MPSSITLKSISVISGYSVSTVSKALNDKSDISSHTRELIKTIANKYNYIPNNFAVALRKQRAKAISVIIPQVNKSFYSCFLFNIEKVAYDYGYRIILFQSLKELSKEKEFISKSSDGSVDGVIIISNNNGLLDAYQGENSNLPIEYVKIDDSLSKELLKEISLMSFSSLLNRIN
ncbi:LacI family DNA-binding transcriptional regulator [Psychroserpens luteus]|uniref:LacI family DNA-binding transcriptional regulator n=1 Tax=Psychroserpens luteus TaxID=1434066 RepID=A0ABW5ZZR1_9FLAO|nr:LacI family DNA-binding transcriptional regulator [Psychroserpens luteus]